MTAEQRHRARPLEVSVSTSAKAGLRVPGLAAWLRSVAPSRTKGEVSVAIVSDALVRRLNRDFRGIDRVTDVLSFPARQDRPAQPVPPPRAADPLPLLGDIVIAAGVARRQAREAGHSVQAEVRILSLHGLLHLLGYDHETDRGAMARLETRLRRKGRLKAGLIERADA